MSDRWIVVDERRLPYVVFDTRVLADTALGATELVVVVAVAWHTDMRAYDAPLPLATVAEYAGVSESTARRALAQAVEAGYVYARPQPGRATLYGLHEAAEFPLPLWPSPWRPRAAGGGRVDPPAAQDGQRWLVSVHPAMDAHIPLDCRVLVDRRLDDVAIAVYAGLAWHRRRTSGRAWPSLATLQAYTGAGKAQVRRAIDALEAAGYIGRSQRPGATTVFSLLRTAEFPAPDGWSPWTPATADPVADPGPRESRDLLARALADPEGPLARDLRAGSDPPTPATADPLLSTTPVTADPVSSTTPATADPPPSHSGPGTPKPLPIPPTPPSSRFDAPRGSRWPKDQGSGGRRADRAIPPGQRPAARANPTNRAIREATRLADNWRHVLAADPELRPDFEDRVRHLVHGSTEFRGADVDAVVAAGLTALAEISNPNH